jgi:hypothetical protein
VVLRGASDGGVGGEGGAVGVFVFVVPVLLVVVLGYAVGYTVWEAAGLGGNPEPAGWLTGLALVAAVSWLLLSRRARLKRALRRARVRGDGAESARLGAELARRRRGRG